MLYFSLLQGSVLRPSPNSGRRRKEAASVFDEYGSIPEIAYAYTAIEQASPVIAFRTRNETIVAFMVPAAGLEVPLGARALNGQSLHLSRVMTLPC